VCPFIGGLGASSGVSYLRKTVIGRGLTLRAIINGRPSSYVIRARGLRQVRRPGKQDRRAAELEGTAAARKPDREAMAMMCECDQLWRAMLPKFKRMRFFVATLSVVLFTSRVGAADLLIRCPSEGLFDAPPKIGDQPNPSAGWQMFLEGTPVEVELSHPSETWLITCRVNIGGATVEINAYMSKNRSCQIAPNGGVVTSLKNGGQSCLIGSSNSDALHDRCVVHCK
jgi:hypothetical protein